MRHAVDVRTRGAGRRVPGASGAIRLMRAPLLLVGGLGVTPMITAGIPAIADPCPESSICASGAPSCSYSTLTNRDTTISVSNYLYSYKLTASYDLPRGLASVSSSINHEAGSGIRVGAVDLFHAEGVPPGTPLVFRATLRIRAYLQGGYLCGAATGDFELQEGSANVQSHSVSTACSGYFAQVDSSLEVVVTRSAGEPFTLSYGVGCTGDLGAAASAEVVLGFEDLPAGVRVVSCQGYGTPAVSARARSWGSLKARYR